MIVGPRYANPIGESMSARLKILAQASPHRYTRLRIVTQAITLALLFAVPLLGLARFDLWRGNHWSLFHATDGLTGFVTVLLAIPAFYLPTFALNAFLGRVFCGFGCPVGQSSRLAEASLPKAFGYAAVFAAAILAWWVDLAVFVSGDARAISLATAAYLALVVAIVAHGRFWRWSFCRRWCPIGIYYSAVQTDHGFGIHFDHPDQCRDCGVCVDVCPVSLDPRVMDRPIRDLGGLALDGFPSENHCLRCGDCVRACELVRHKDESLIVPLRLGRRA